MYAAKSIAVTTAFNDMTGHALQLGGAITGEHGVGPLKAVG
jgi:hypothetical protein